VRSVADEQFTSAPREVLVFAKAAKPSGWVHMQRRKFIGLVGGAAAWPLAAGAQQPSRPVIGFLSTRSAKDSGSLVSAFGKGLEEAGFLEGKTVSTEYRFADGALDRLRHWRRS